MKKLFVLFAFLFCFCGANAQNLNRYISISIPMISTSLYNDEVCLNIINGSSCNIAIDFIIVYKTSSKFIYLEYGDGSITYSNGITSIQFVYSEGGYMMMGGWIVEMQYKNLADGKYYTKRVIKREISFSTNTPLEDISDPDTDGINSITKETEYISQYFDMSGRLLQKPKKGINIIRMRNGKVKKVFVK